MTWPCTLDGLRPRHPQRVPHDPPGARDVIPPMARSTEEWGEVPGAAIRVQREGGRLPAGYTRVLSRVIVKNWVDRDCGPSGLRCDEPDGMRRDILLISK